MAIIRKVTVCFSGLFFAPNFFSGPPTREENAREKIRGLGGWRRKRRPPKPHWPPTRLPQSPATNPARQGRTPSSPREASPQKQGERACFATLFRGGDLPLPLRVGWIFKAFGLFPFFLNFLGGNGLRSPPRHSVSSCPFIS